MPVKDARRFAETFGAQLRIFPQGEHPLMGNRGWKRFGLGGGLFLGKKNEVGRQEKASVPLKFVGIAGIIKMYWSAFSQCRGKNHVAPLTPWGGQGRAQRARRKERNVMSKPVYITADSTCDLTPALLERFHVKTIPLHIVLGEGELLRWGGFYPGNDL